MKKILILGAGITGLSAAWKLSEKGYDVEILEMDSLVGGLAKTIKFKNSLVDIGPHSFFSENKEIYDTVKSLFKDEPQEIPKVTRSVKMFFMNYYVDYPLSAKSILFQMGPIIPLKSFLSFLRSFIKSIFTQKKLTEKQSIEEWAIGNFGFFLFKNFFKPYTEQFWKIKTENLSHRVIPASKKLDFAKTLKHLFFNKYLEFSKREPGDLNLVQRESLPTFYPKKGFGQIAEKIKQKIENNNVKIHLNTKVEKITLKGNKKFEIDTSKVSFESDYLISTLPLDYLVKNFEPLNSKENLKIAAQNLEYLALKMVYLIVKKKDVLDCQYCYFVGRPYNRVSNLNLFSDDISKEGTSALSLEISCHKGSKTWLSKDKDIFEECIKNLENDKILLREDILDWKVLNVPNVYPIYKLNYENHLEIIKNEFDSIDNFFSVGRLGQFYYGDIDQMMKLGFDTANKILKN